MLQKLSRFFLGVFWLGISCAEKGKTFDDSQVFRYNEHANISTLDPAFSKDLRTIWATSQLFNGLVQLNDSLQVLPDIAKSWEISDNGLEYSFFLREDVFFHKHELFGLEKTRNVTASDFVYSFQRLKDPKVASPGKWVLNYVASFNAVEKHVFKIRLKQAFPPFLSLLSMKYCAVVPKEAVVFFGDNFRSNPIGTGPFQFKLWVENTKLIFRKNPNYYEKDDKGNRLPYMEAVSISFLPDKQSEFLQFIQGNLDFLNSIDVSYKDDLLTQEGKLQMRYTEEINLISSPFLNTEYLGFCLDQTKEKAVHSKKIRQAMNYGFDREKMILYLRNGIGTPAVHGFIPKGLPSFCNEQGYEYNPEKARQLVQSYTEETGDENPTLTIHTDSQYVDLCAYIQRALEKVGLTVSVQVMPPSTLRQAKVNGQLSMYRGSWIADYPDAENYLFIFHSDYFSPNGPNYTHFENKKFDSLYAAANQLTAAKQRHLLYQKMDRILIEEAPVVPLYYDVALRFTRKNIKNLGINPINHLHLKHVQKLKTAAFKNEVKEAFLEENN
jgi:peptide/nickel transport system substrate-binding protein